MTTATVENRQPATVAEKPEPVRKATAAAPRPRVAPARAKSTHKTTPAKKRAAAAHKAAITARVRRGSKTAKVLELLKRSSGATLPGLMKATGWQPHSVRGFVSTLGKKMGLHIASRKTSDGERVYSLAK